eukprot:6192322-Pleurochrysis_carterae.AAC.7
MVTAPLGMGGNAEGPWDSSVYIACIGSAASHQLYIAVNSSHLPLRVAAVLTSILVTHDVL